MACSPDQEIYMIIQEPETCKYVCVLYHPSVCLVEGMDLRDTNDQELQHDNGLYDLAPYYDEEL